MCVSVSVTLKSSLVFLIDELCAQMGFTLNRFESSGLRSYVLLFLFRRKHMLKKKISQSKIPSHFPDTHTHVYLVHIYKYTCRDLVHLDFLGSPGVSSRPLGSHSNYPPAVCVCVCVCVRVHTYTHIHSNPLLTWRKYRQHLYLPHVKNNTPCQQQVPCIE